MNDGRACRVAWWAGLVAAVALSPDPAAWGDTFHLRDGGQIEGEEVGRREGLVSIRTRQAELSIEAKEIVRVEKSPLSWALYQQKLDQTPATADGHLELARWCRQNKLDDLADRELREALRLDPGHAATRRTLGHVQIGDIWLDPRARAPARPVGPTTRPGVAGSAEKDLTRALRGEWYKKILTIRSTYLGGSKALFSQGADMLMAIRDPLAIEPMIQLLGEGAHEQRRLLVTLLGNFDTPVATTTLLEAAVLDDEGSIRRAAIGLLGKRSDPRIADYLIKSLANDDDDAVRNAAAALASLRILEAVPALARGLVSTEVRRVRTDPVVRAFRQYFVDDTGQLHTITVRRTIRPGGTRLDNVNVYRTDIRNALIALTGETYGFDPEPWLDWYRRNAPKPAPAEEKNKKS